METLTIRPNVYYTVEETAQLLRVSTRTVLRLLHSVKSPGVKIGKEWRILGGMLLNLPLHDQDPKVSLVTEWLGASLSSLQEVWDNEEDALYDQL